MLLIIQVLTEGRQMIQSKYTTATEKGASVLNLNTSSKIKATKFDTGNSVE